MNEPSDTVSDSQAKDDRNEVYGEDLFDEQQVMDDMDDDEYKLYLSTAEEAVYGYAVPRSFSQFTH